MSEKVVMLSLSLEKEAFPKNFGLPIPLLQIPMEVLLYSV